MNSIFELRSVTKKKGGELILKKISCKIRGKEIFVIIGPSGSGKTTLLRLLNRLDDPTSGEIIFKGESIESMDVLSLRRTVQMVFQTPLLFPGTVEENIRIGADFYGIPVDSEELIKTVGLEMDLLKKDSKEISVGQAQRVAIARSLAMRPEVLLLDEPTASLDPASTLGIEELIKELRDSRSLTTVFVTHNIEQIKRIGDRGMLIVNGEKIEEGPILEIIESPKTKELEKFLKGELK